MIVLHIIIALSSMLFAFYTFIRPSQRKIYGSYLLVALTIITGTYLIITMPAHLVQTCIMGIIYLAGVSTATVLAQKKLHKAVQKG